METYQSKFLKSKLKRYGDLKKETSIKFNEIKKTTKRQPYVRSAYFKKEKIFFDFFWEHIFQKSPKIRVKRLQYFEASLDLIKNSRNKPEIKDNPHKTNEKLYRFLGITKDKYSFFVQIKEDKKTGKKYLMSCFPVE